jgi:hypothetical protein
MTPSAFLAKLKRRRVFRVAAVFALLDLAFDLAPGRVVRTETPVPTDAGPESATIRRGGEAPVSAGPRSRFPVDPSLDRIREQPRFRALLARMNVV